MAMAKLMEPWVVALISAIASGSVTIIGAVYWFGRNSVTVADLHELRDLAIKHRDELKVEIAAERREVGEGLHALRERINNVDLDLAKNYVRRESWHQAMNQLQTQLQAADKAAEERMMRLEGKLDRLAERMAEASARGRP